MIRRIGYNEKDPLIAIDRYGRLVPAVNRFPSSSDGQGFKPLADYIHSKGLKFGIHIMRGIPTLAVKRIPQFSELLLMQKTSTTPTRFAHGWAICIALMRPNRGRRNITIRFSLSIHPGG